MTRIKLNKQNLEDNPNLAGYIDQDIFDEYFDPAEDIIIRDEVGNIEPNSKRKYGDELATKDLNEFEVEEVKPIAPPNGLIDGKPWNDFLIQRKKDEFEAAIKQHLEENFVNIEDEVPVLDDRIKNDPQVVGYMDKEQQNLIYKIAIGNKVEEYRKEMPQGSILGVLDIGSGRCDMFTYLRENHPGEMSYVGVDNNPIMVQTSHETLPDDFVNSGGVIQQDWFSLTDEFEPDEFDWTFCIGSLNVNYGTGPKDKWDKFLETVKIGLYYAKKGVSLILLHSDPTGNYQDFPIPICIDKIMEFYPNNRFEVSYKDTEFIYKVDILKENW